MSKGSKGSKVSSSTYVWAFRIVISVMIMAATWKLASYYNERVLKNMTKFDRDAVRDKMKKVKRTDLIVFEISNLVYYVILAIGASFVVSFFGFSNMTFVAVLGTIGLAFSLATQRFLTGIVSGIVVTTNRMYEIGDFVKFQEKGHIIAGRVINFDLLRTTVMTEKGEIVSIPNEDITGGEIYVDYALK